MGLVNWITNLFRIKKPKLEEIKKSEYEEKVPNFLLGPKSQIGYFPIHNFGKNLNEPKKGSMKGAYTSPEEFFFRGIELHTSAGIGVVKTVIGDNHKLIQQSQNKINELAKRTYRESTLINDYSKENSRLNLIASKFIVDGVKEKENASQ